MRYCPNCSAELKTVRAPMACWNCDADFSQGSAWRPTDTPSGVFRLFPKEAPASPPAAVHAPADVPPAPIRAGGTAFKTILRLFVGLMTLIPLVMALDPKASLLARGLGAGGVVLGLVIIATIGRAYDFALGLFLLALGSVAVLGGLDAADQPFAAHAPLLIAGFTLCAVLLGALARPWPKAVRWLLQAAALAMVVPLLLLSAGNELLAGGIVSVGLGIFSLAGTFGGGRRKTV